MRQLPPESATATALRLNPLAEGDELTPDGPHDPETEQWSRAEQLIAEVRDELLRIRWLYSTTHSERGKGPKWKPDPLPRPGITPKAQKARLAPEQASLLARHLARTQGELATYN